ncbi:two-component regulator propeller domain-containing protein [Wocania ichthyoenteri]|uniref:two-component regulator propeller domain-containing protein n=1 Tax=Wocania ichthyoenteri TaxID=1230531 RepID=UPI00053DC70A|nr:two-component regulator propeller domain-containing protein [Wocania ichthyoenteri]
MFKGLIFIRISSLVILLIFINLKCFGKPNYSIKQISIKEGLLQSKVKCILNDHRGNLWIGTQGGLNRFDGYELKGFSYDKEDVNSLPSNDIVFIAEDASLNLWVATSRGLALYDRKNKKFKRIYFQDEPFQAFSCLLMDDGVLFAGKGGILYKFFYKVNILKPLQIKMPGNANIQFEQLVYLNENTILANSRWRGMYLYDIKNKEIRKIDSLNDPDYVNIFVDSQQRIWLTAYGKGVFCYSSNWKLLHHFSTKNSPLTNDIVLDFEEKNGELWVATDGGGINILSLKDFTFSAIKNVPDDINSIPTNSIFCLYNDLQNNMWIGTVMDGLLRIKNTFTYRFQNAPFGNPYGLSNKAVLSLLEDENGKIWIGTDGGGINLFDPATNTFKHYPLTKGDKVSSMVNYSDHELLLSLFSEGLVIFNKQTGSYRPFIIVNPEENRKNSASGFLINISKYAEDEILINGNHIYVYNIRKKTFTKLASKGIEYNSSSPVEIASDSTKTYFITHEELFELDRQTNQFKTLYTPDVLVYIKDACRDKQGRFWIGTTSGIVCIDPTNNTTNKIETTLFDGVNSLVFDEHERLWIGANNMLYTYKSDQNYFTILNGSDGIAHNEYIGQAHLLSREGDIYMGGTTGLCKIDKDIPFNTTLSANVTLMDVMLNGVSVADNITEAIHKIKIPWNFTSLSLKVIVRGKDMFQKNIFRYNIRGLNGNNIETYDHTLSIYSLPVGEYIIFVSSDSNNGGWTEPTELLGITVTPAWWQSAWFILSTLFVLLAVIFFISSSIIKNKRKKQLWEIAKIKQKTYEDKVQFFTNISHELRTPLTLIYAPLERLLKFEKTSESLNLKLESIFRQVKQMKNIVNTLLDIRKIEVGKETLNVKPHQLNNWIHSVANDFKHEFRVHRTQIVYDFDQSIDEVPFDKTKCKTVLSNLLTNALKFSIEDTEVVLSTRKFENKVIVSIKDQGIGLDGVDLNNLFTDFYQGSHNIYGSGIGLSYSKSLIELHGGVIGAKKNEIGQGATFYFELPTQITNVIASHSEAMALNTSDINYQKTEYFDTKPYSIIIVEDQPELRSFIKDSLKENFKHTYIAKDGVEALTIIKQYHPDIIISDVMMNKMNGFDLCLNVKKDIDISHIPIILLTAFNDADNTLRGYKLGANAYLSKPFDIEFLLTIIRNQLRDRANVRSRYENNMLSMIAPEETTISNVDEQFLLKLNNIIAENISNNKLNLKFLTDKMFISRASLSLKVKALTGISTMDYVTQMRIEKATNLLLYSEENITEIAIDLGFSSPRYFSKVFKEKKDMTPTEFRQNKDNKQLDK